MPLYDYKCATCGKVTEVRHGFDEKYGEPCEHCGGELKRQFNPAGIVFKGSGFYITDSRQATKKASESKSSGTASAETKNEAKTETKTESKSESKPQTKPESKSSSKESAA